MPPETAGGSVPVAARPVSEVGHLGAGPGAPDPIGPLEGSRAGARRRLAGTALVVVAVTVGSALRFVAPPDLWLDEAQSVAIARLPLPQLLDALRQDGSPPLYYVLLHAWMAVFGTGGVAVRALSGLLSVLALPVAWVLGSRLAGRRTALALLLLLATSPFAVRYGSETRMYALLLLLVLLAGLAVHWAVRCRGGLPVVAVGACVAGLLLTHYWALYLVTVGGLVTLAVAARRACRRPALRVLAGLALGGLAFLPWLPSFVYQLAHTGTPWAASGGWKAIPVALWGWQGGGTLLAVLLGHALTFLVVLALVTVPEDETRGTARVVRLGLTRNAVNRIALVLFLGTLLLAGVASLVSGSAVAARYTTVALPAFLLLAAAGVAALPGRRPYAAVLAALVLLGTGPAVARATAARTQAGEVAAALDAAAPGDTVLFCPDQLGPSVARVAPAGLDLVGYPDLRPAGRVDWVDYAERNRAADPAEVAAAVDARAAGHAVWVVTGKGYRVPSDADCSQVRQVLADLRGPALPVLARDPSFGEGMRVHRFAAGGPATG